MLGCPGTTKGFPMSVIAIVLVILALICFGLATFGRSIGGSINLLPAGLFCATLAVALPALSAAL